MIESVEVFPWNKNFETGIVAIDEQHKVLVKLINQLASHLGSESDVSSLDATYTELADYAAYHFQSEERIWEEYFPTNSSLKGHKKTHEDFIATVIRLKEQDQSEPIQEVIEQVLSFLTRWLAHHILDSDMRMSKVIFAMQSGMSLQSAELQAEKDMSGVMAVMIDTTLGMYDHLCERTISLKREVLSRKKTEASLQLTSRVFSDTHDGIIITDAKGNIQDVNPAFCRITGYNREEIIGQNPSILSSGKQPPKFYADMWQTINEDGHWEGEVWNRKKGGEVYAELLSISSLKDEDDNVTHYLGVFSDITQSKQQQEKLNMMAHYDVLTELPNRALFADRFQQATARNKRSKQQLAVCFLDLDNFKPINDTYGHDVGDEILVQVARRIKDTIREEDTVSRQGGDEFALLLSDILSPAQCEQLLDRILFVLAEPYFIDGIEHNLSASCGVTSYPHDESDLDTLLRHADHAMYEAKQAGRNRHCWFSIEQDQQATYRNHQREEVEHALNNNELCMYYQPKVSMGTGDVFGAEALIRWIHPTKGLIPPLDFLPSIDGTDIEVQVGDWVIEQALSQIEQWNAQDINIEVSVNISSHHMQSPKFIPHLESALAKYPNIDSKYLQLEILESSALANLDVISSIVKSCRDSLGVHVSLDDFGTGYSSLTHLRNLPASTIKIDQTFIRDMLDDPNDHAIVDGVIGLADSFDRGLIAEGVETNEHGLMLLAMGCKDAQGYGIAKPMPADLFPNWLKDYQPNEAWVSCASQTLSTKENKLKLFRLVIEKWQTKFEETVLSQAGTMVENPIMNHSKCHCGKWIQRAKKEQLFEKEWLDKFEQSHQLAHAIADDLLSKYHDGAQISLDELQAAFDDINHNLEKWF